MRLLYDAAHSTLAAAPVVGTLCYEPGQGCYYCHLLVLVPQLVRRQQLQLMGSYGGTLNHRTFGVVRPIGEGLVSCCHIDFDVTRVQSSCKFSLPRHIL